MKAEKFILIIIVILVSLQCNKDNNVGPEKDNIPVSDIGTYYFLPHGVATIPPNEVNLFCNVIDTAKNPVDFLTADRFSLKENDVAIDASKAVLSVRKRDTFNYNLNTILLLDVSSVVNIEALKKAVLQFVSAIDPDQSIGIYTFSTKINTIQTLTKDADQLTGAVDNIVAGTAERNLLGAIKFGLTLFSEFYSPGNVEQCQLVVFTAGQDTKNEVTKDEIIYTSQFGNVYTIGIGNNLDQDMLDQVGNRGFYAVTDENKLEEVFANVQESVIGFADSYYRIVYQSSLRGTEAQQVELSILANAYDGTGSTMTDVFKTDQFADISNGMIINWTPDKPEGIDTLIVGVNLPRRLTALSYGGDKIPSYEWSCEDISIMSIEPIAATNNTEAIVHPLKEGMTSLIVDDKANGFAHTVIIQSVQSYDGLILREWWDNISGSKIADLTSNARFPDFPTGRQYINASEAPVSFGDNYGTRLRGFLRPQVSGTYSFWIASDDQSQLYLSMSADPSQKVQIAGVDSWTNSRTFDTYASQHSAKFELEAGKFYYIEVLHKEGGGGDNLAFAWQGPEISRTVISAEYLSAWLGD